MIVALALATQTAPAAWWDEDDATIVTALALLEEMREATDGG
jgi:hypothetical protein